MKVNIYYGGRGLPDDPTIYVLRKVEKVLEELQVKTDRYNLFEERKQITTLPNTLKEADAIILATTVEWYGIGGDMQQFLDACWLYGDKEKIKELFMQPVVMSTTYGEKEAQLTLMNAWEMLGGTIASGLCGYVENLEEFEKNKEYTRLIEKRAENFYRTISQKLGSLPTSNQAVRNNVLRTNNIDLTPQESEQLSKYVSNDKYVEKQKEDIKELTSMFKGLLEQTEPKGKDEFVELFEKNYDIHKDCDVKYLFHMPEKSSNFIVYVKDEKLHCYYSQEEQGDVMISASAKALEEIVHGNMTFQRAFMTGVINVKGDFVYFRLLDQMFPFAQS